MESYAPYKDRAEHDYINVMTVILAKQRLIIKQATEITDVLQRTVEEHIRLMRRSREDVPELQETRN